MQVRSAVRPKSLQRTYRPATQPPGQHSQAKPHIAIRRGHDDELETETESGRRAHCAGRRRRAQMRARTTLGATKKPSCCWPRRWQVCVSKLLQGPIVIDDAHARASESSTTSPGSEQSHAESGPKTIKPKRWTKL